MSTVALRGGSVAWRQEGAISNPAETKIFGAVLSLEPPIVFTALGGSDLTGWLNAWQPLLGPGPAALLVYRISYLAAGLQAKKSVALTRHYRQVHPGHELFVLCNAPDEVATMAHIGEPALLLNHNLTVSEKVFRPLPDTEVVFDAIYSARPDVVKRIELAAAIERVAYASQIPDEPSAYAARILAHMRSLAPRHVILTDPLAGGPAKLKGEEMNLAYNRAAVGLCLSAVEGAMVSSMEYMLAGLPIVSTPSVGGRDLFFDPEYCLIVPPDPRAIRDAVAALRMRNIPREHVRAKTLARMEPQRRAFLALLDGFLERHGYEPRFAGDWPWLGLRSLNRMKTFAEECAQAASNPISRPLKR